LNHKLIILVAVVLVVSAILSLFLVQNWLSSNQTPGREFYVGVMFAYGNETSQVKALVDKVKDYTNFFILGSTDLLESESALTEACDYIYNANLSFIVQFRGLQIYNYSITDWMLTAPQRYGSQFLGVYRYDEPGGSQLDGDPSQQLINSTAAGPNPTYASVSNTYVSTLSYFTSYYLNYSRQIFTSDYALYWFDYKANYSTVFAEFVGNQSRDRHIALCRGAANAFNKDWGVIVTWKYNQAPYLESGVELYDDLALAYSSGAKYAVVFSYSDPIITPYGTLTDDHFDALQLFWNRLHSDPSVFGEKKPQVAYVVPADYGFGFRSATDNIWGLFPADENSSRFYSDVQTLIEKYDTHLNILYDESIIIPLLQNYSSVFYWNQTIG
jgi:hypothetical protein